MPTSTSRCSSSSRCKGGGRRSSSGRTNRSSARWVSSPTASWIRCSPMYGYIRMETCGWRKCCPSNRSICSRARISSSSLVMRDTAAPGSSSRAGVAARRFVGRRPSISLIVSGRIRSSRDSGRRNASAGSPPRSARTAARVRSTTRSAASASASAFRPSSRRIWCRSRELSRAAFAALSQPACRRRQHR